MLTQKTFTLKDADHVKKWHLVDAKEQVVGRLATQIANILRGKHNPQFTPNMDSGDYVVVVNAEKVRFTGNKLDDKKYYRHSGYVGGLKERTAKEQFEKRPEMILELAVKRMLPGGALSRKQLKKLKIFVGEDHNLQAQNPQPLEL